MGPSVVTVARYDGGLLAGYPVRAMTLPHYPFPAEIVASSLADWFRAALGLH